MPETAKGIPRNNLAGITVQTIHPLVGIFHNNKVLRKAVISPLNSRVQKGHAAIKADSKNFNTHYAPMAIFLEVLKELVGQINTKPFTNKLQRFLGRWDPSEVPVFLILIDQRLDLGIHRLPTSKYCWARQRQCFLLKLLNCLSSSLSFLKLSPLPTSP